MNLSKITISQFEKPEEENLAVYRLKTENYKSSKRTSFTSAKKLTKMIKLSRGFDALEEDFYAVGNEALEKIINLHTVSDGLYVIKATNFSTDWETGCVDDWDLILDPYKKEK